ncbi:uncharacterized protein V1478_007000 [Vespula squamosa]|uniref:Uncharacterized protein n=1 Tax=Vespula squamosa TaxID=30214 RepID=A0ABD2B1Y0_VESSQ
MGFPFLCDKGGVQQFQDISNVSTLHDLEGYDKGHNAQSRLHGGLSRVGSSIAAGPPPPFATDDLVNQRSFRGASVKGVHRLWYRLIPN